MMSRGKRFLVLALAALALMGMQASAVLASSTGDRITGLKLERGSGHSTTIRLGGSSNDSLDLTAVTQGGTPDEYKWTCSNSAVVELSADDAAATTVTPLAKGSARITVTAENGTNSKTTSILVRVVELASDIKITDMDGDEITSDLTVYLNKSVTVKGVVDSDASMKTVVWESADPAVATVTAGKIIGKSVGTTTVTASTKDWDNAADKQTATITVNVMKAASAVKIEKDGTDDVTGDTLKYSLSGNTISPDDTIELYATALMEDGADAGEQTFKWMTSNKKTADLSVSQDTRTATLQLGAKGTSTISAYDQTSGKRVKVTVQVSKAPTGVEVSTVTGGATGTVTLAEGKSVTLRAVVTPTDANNSKVTWISSKPEVASVNATGKVTGIKYDPDPVTITATTVDGSVMDTIAVEVQPAVSEMKILDAGTDVTNKSREIINDGTVSTITLTAEGDRSDGTAYNAASTEWSVSGSKAADFGGQTTETGASVTVDIKRAGKATVTAKATDGSGKKAIYKLVVLQPATSIAPSNGISNYEVGVGKPLMLKAKVGPDDASKKTVTWSTTTPDLVSVNAKTGRVTGLARGTATVVATADGGNAVTCSFTVAVKDMAQSVQLKDNNTGELLNGAVLYLDDGSGDTIDLKADVVPATAVGKMIWTSSSNKIAEVVPTGDGSTATVSPLKRGRTQIRAKAADGSNRYAVVTVQVVVPIQSIQIVPDATEVAQGRGVNLKLKFTPDDASSQKVTWESANPEVATVNSTGRVSGKAAGSTTITATTVGGLSASCHITVNPAVSKVSLIRGSTELNRELDVLLSDGSLSLSASVEPSDASQTLVWSSSNSKVASVDQHGNVTLHSVGSTNIRATSTDGTNRSDYVVLQVKRVLN